MSGEVRAITLHQPWASLIAWGVKTIETRSWLPPAKLMPGLVLLVHAGKKIDAEACHAVSEIREALKAHDVRTPVDLPTGAVLAVTSCYRAVRDPGFIELAMMDGQQPFGHFGPGRCYWLLSSTVDVLDEPVQATGRQGLWKPPSFVLDAVHSQVPNSVWLRDSGADQ